MRDRRTDRPSRAGKAGQRPAAGICSFLHRAQRKVRKDATVRYAGKLLEVRAELTGKWVELRYDPADPEALPGVFLDGSRCQIHIRHR